jgi:glutamate N-acetyltransferase/amino-acid N-acetyltransferase
MHLLSPAGFRAGGVTAGIKVSGRPDVALLLADQTAVAAGCFTRNHVVAAPVIVGREHLLGGRLRAIVINSGNANACTGQQGLKDARRMCALTADLVGCEAQQVLPSSTGIIGHVLPMDKVEAGIRSVAEEIGNSKEHSDRFMSAILTTDTRPKQAAVQVKIGKQQVTIAGVCKGAGMIGPRMGPPQATMLAYLTTDADIPPARLQRAMTLAVNQSFNSVIVDDHASTNDTAIILASGRSSRVADAGDVRKFTEALAEVTQSLAIQIAADGEGATKVVKIVVTNAGSDAAARAIARNIANSPLVKCAMHGNDPNWGRIVSAAGYAGVPFDPDRAMLTLQKTVVFRRGRPVDFDAAQVSKALDAKEVVVHLNCNQGDSEATIWTCDLSREYVAINADYHT